MRRCHGRPFVERHRVADHQHALVGASSGATVVVVAGDRRGGRRYRTRRCRRQRVVVGQPRRRRRVVGAAAAVVDANWSSENAAGAVSGSGTTSQNTPTVTIAPTRRDHTLSPSGPPRTEPNRVLDQHLRDRRGSKCDGESQRPATASPTFPCAVATAGRRRASATGTGCTTARRRHAAAPSRSSATSPRLGRAAHAATNTAERSEWRNRPPRNSHGDDGPSIMNQDSPMTPRNGERRKREGPAHTLRRDRGTTAERRGAAANSAPSSRLLARVSVPM